MEAETRGHRDERGSPPSFTLYPVKDQSDEQAKSDKKAAKSGSGHKGEKSGGDKKSFFHDRPRKRLLGLFVFLENLKQYHSSEQHQSDG